MNAIEKALLWCLLILLVSCSDTKQSERLFAHFVKKHVERIKPINKKYYEAVWATYSGKSSISELFDEARIADSLYKKASEPIEYYQGLLNNVYDNASEFDMLLKIKESGLLTDSLQKRQFINVFRDYIITQNNWNESDNKKKVLYEKFFDLKRNESAFWDSVKHTENPDARREWIEQFADLTDEFKGMIMAMNMDAQRLGYSNYFQAIMDFNGVDYFALDELCDLITIETDSDYRKLMALSNAELCNEFGLKPNEVTPQHYRKSIKEITFPSSWQLNYSQQEAIGLMRKFFALGDYQIDDILDNSDLWFAEGKLDQSFFVSLDPDEEDYRVYANIKPNTWGIYTLLHEFAHAMHFKYVDRNIPYLLREPHQITTEAVSIYFNNKLYYSTILQHMLGIDTLSKPSYFEEFTCPSTLTYLRMLVRNIQFEKNIYENPDLDYNQLWWDLTEQYLLYPQVSEVDRVPEWITNQHVINASGIHVFYLYAYAFSAQLEEYFPDGKIGGLKNTIMKYGDSIEWNKLLEIATGEPLNFRYLFNSYKKVKMSSEPISVEIKSSDGLFMLEEKIYQELVRHDVYTISM